MAKTRDSLGIDPAMTFGEIGAVLGCTRQRAEQIYWRAIHKIRRSNPPEDIAGMIAEVERYRGYARPGKSRKPPEWGV